ncbi:MAG: AEC family transporter, partial [Thermomicrobiales bacterium]
VFHASVGAAALAALAASSPNVAFFGPVVLGNLHGEPSGLPVAIGSLVNTLTVMPATVILLTWDAEQRAQPVGSHEASPAARPTGSARRNTPLAPVILAAARQSIVWLPALGVLGVLLRFAIPAELAGGLELLGQSATGVALFAAGIVIAGHRVILDRTVLALAGLKNLVQPALVLGALAWLGAGNQLISLAVISAALPSLVAIALFGVQYRVAETQAASVLLVSMAGSLVTLTLFIALTGT